ncbi:MAG: hypothetical protein K2Y21_01595 [Phycisphaerales bacterium]|nr:hypothetical protein [Phycisphaerales bacterium]
MSLHSFGMCLVFGAASASWAGTIVWSGLGDGLTFTQNQNWVGNVAPGAGDDAVVGSGPAIEIPFNTQITVKSLSCARPLKLNGFARLSTTGASSIAGMQMAASSHLACVGDLTISGTSTANFATLDGPGRVIIPAGASFTFVENGYLTGALDNAGTLEVRAPVGFFGCVLTNLPGATLRFNGTPGAVVPLQRSTPTGNSLHNQGTLQITGGVSAQIGLIDFTNSGICTVSSGSLELQTPVANSGTLSVALGSTLELDDSHTGPGTVSGAGTIRFSGGTTSFAPGKFLHTGPLEFGSAFSNITFADSLAPQSLSPLRGTVTFQKKLNVANVKLLGTAVFNADQSFATLQLGDPVAGTNATLDGTGQVTITGQLLNGGLMQGTGKTVLAAAANYTTSSAGLQLDRTLENFGTITLVRSIQLFSNGKLINRGTITLSDSSILGGCNGTSGLENKPEGTIVYDIPAPTTPSIGCGGGTLHLNEGTIIKKGDGLVSYLSPLLNRGTIDCRAGEFKIFDSRNRVSTELWGGTWKLSGNGRITFFNLPDLRVLVSELASGIPARIFIEGPSAGFGPNDLVHLTLVDTACLLSLAKGAELTSFYQVFIPGPNGGSFNGVPCTWRGDLFVGTGSTYTAVNGYVQQPESTFEVQVGGTTPSTYGRVRSQFQNSVGGDVRNRGRLRVSLAPGFVPTTNVPVPIVTASPLLPFLDWFTAGVQTPPGTTTTRDDTHVYFQLGAGVCIGDLSHDGQVDDADFQLFAAAYNILDCADPAMPAGCPADLNGDGLVDDADFQLFVVVYNAVLCP